MNAIRATGANNLLAIGGSRSWARYADGFVAHPINDFNWAAAIHPYDIPSEFDGVFAYCKVGWRAGGPVCVAGVGER